MNRDEINKAFDEEYIKYREAFPKDYKLPKEWVGLTDAEVERIKLDGRDLEFVSMTALHRFARDIQAKLKDKNT